jgi:peroxidase
MNQITHWLDGSNVYGSNITEANNLRLFINGQLRTSSQPGRPLLPLSGSSSDPWGSSSTTLNSNSTFLAGDNRVNEQIALTLMHTVWLREHNRIAAVLQTTNAQASDEQLYQEARRIVWAEMQHITYNEWLPIVLGPTYMDKYGLYPLQGPGRDFGSTHEYNSSINPSILNEFATAAFRFGHSLLPAQLRYKSNNQEYIKLMHICFKPMVNFDVTLVGSIILRRNFSNKFLFTQQ